MPPLPLWKIISRESCPKHIPNCKTCIIQKRCITNAKRAERTIKEHYQLIPRNQTIPEDIIPIFEKSITS